MAENSRGLSLGMQGEKSNVAKASGESRLWAPNEVNATRSTTNEPRSTNHVEDNPSKKEETLPGTNAASRLSRVSQRSQKPKKSGGFLLQGTVAESNTAEENAPQRKRNSRRLLQSIRPKSSRAQEKSNSATSRDGLGITADQDGREGSTASPQKSELNVKKTRDASREAPAPEELDRPDRSSLDAESAQIVDMALRVSQSRRLASQRLVSQQLPPRLSPLPDTSGVSSLRQHLLQQRKMSRTGSPRPDRVTPRNASGLRHAFESFDVTATDGGYRYHVSQSTLARVQKAKEYIELMAQYRRLLEHVPPLRANGSHPPPTATSMRSSPRSSAYNTLGRQYNPLQYIRNRKVRARERQAIDGEAQGFKDVAQVTSWIDEIDLTSHTSLEPSVASEITPPLPVYHQAEMASADVFTASTSSNASAKPNRPRVDWIVEPADMIADVYWLEQGSNKLLIEDRQWSRLYPRGSDLEVSLRHMSSPQNGPAATVTSRPGTREHAEELVQEKTPDSNPPKVEAEPSPDHPRDRSRLRPRGMHHRHHSSLHSNHDFFRLARGSASDLSDSDNDYRDTRFRSGTITTSSKDILAKQMMEMIAKEEKETTSKPPRPEASRYPPVSYRTPEKVKDPGSKPPSRLHSRQNSFNNATSDREENSGARVQEPHSSLRNRRPRRPRLDVPSGGDRPSLEVERTAPNSPEAVPSRDSYLDISPMPSRGGSPTRNPFSKVKQIFKDPAKERYSINIDEKFREIDVDADLSRWTSDPFNAPSEKRSTSLERQLSTSSNGRPAAGRIPPDAGLGHRRLPSVKVKGDEGAGIRGLLRGPGARIDTVLRTGVSKLGDIIWKKELDLPEAVLSEESSSSDSEGETRGRKGTWPRGSHDESVDVARSYLNQMPEFHHTGRPSDATRTKTSDPVNDMRGSRRLSFQSGGFSDATTQQASQNNKSHLSPDEQSDLSDGPGTGQRARAQAKRLTAMLAVPPSFSTSRHYSSMSRQSDPWSVTVRSRSPEQHAPVSRREIARLRALLLSSGVMAMEIARRANHARPLPLEKKAKLNADGSEDEGDVVGINWRDISDLAEDKAALASQVVAPADMFTCAGTVLNDSIQASTDRWQTSADKFTNETSAGLHADLEALRVRLGADLLSMARAAADDADETNRAVTQTQRFQVKQVVDVIEKMLRRRRRRFRWVRRGLWLGVEWVLVGFMWYVWFVVMMLRAVLGIGTGTIKAVRWLLWL